MLERFFDERAACSWSCMRPSAAASIAPGGWRCEALLPQVRFRTPGRRERRRHRAFADRAHSFPLEKSCGICIRDGAEVLTQAVLDPPMFTTRWRWNAAVAGAAALPGGREVAPQIARMRADDLIAAVFPDQIACAENFRASARSRTIRWSGKHRRLPARSDGSEGLERLLKAHRTGAVRSRRARSTQPSPLALEVLSARPYAYLDDAPLEERRTQAVMARRWISPDASDLGRLDPAAIARVRAEAWPERRMPTSCTMRSCGSGS